MATNSPDDVRSERPKIWTAANIITAVRIFLIPVFVVLQLAPWQAWFPGWAGAATAMSWITIVFFVLLCATDGVDGYVARKRNEVTTLGKFLDPIADKIMVCAALLGFVELGTLPSWIALIIVAREFLVSGLRMVAAYDGIVIAASGYGKWKTFSTMVAIVLFLLKDSPMVLSASPIAASAWNIFAWAVMIVALALTIISMVDYFIKGFRAINAAEEKKPGTPDVDAAAGSDPGTDSEKGD